MDLGEAIKARAMAETARDVMSRTRPLDIKAPKKLHRTSNDALKRQQLSAEARVAQLERVVQMWQTLVAMMAKRAGGELVIDGFNASELPKSLEVTGDPSTGRTFIRVSDEAPNVAASEPLPIGLREEGS